jgi:hypothetical protein
VIIEDKVCLSPDDVPRPIGEAYDEIGLYTDMDDWSQTLIEFSADLEPSR